MKTVFLILLAVPAFVFGATQDKVSKETVLFNGSKITVETFETYDGHTRIVLLDGKNKIGEWKDRTCRGGIRSPGGNKLKNRLLSIVKLSTESNTEYLYCLEEIEMYTYQGLLIGPDGNGKNKIIYSGPARGVLKDYDGDGLFDFLEEGGIGEPTSATTGSYKPYLVFRQTKEHDKINFRVDEDLSKKFSESENFEWHGSKYSEKFNVNKKGKIVH